MHNLAMENEIKISRFTPKMNDYINKKFGCSELGVIGRCRYKFKKIGGDIMDMKKLYENGFEEYPITTVIGQNLFFTKILAKDVK